MTTPPRNRMTQPGKAVQRADELCLPARRGQIEWRLQRCVKAVAPGFGHDFVETSAVVRAPARSHLPVGERIPGPAIVLQKDSTTVIPPGWSALTDAVGNLILKLGGAP